ncbi:hypothetical protein GGR56DRAFT_575279 [Xylariaceae sp. FL0804]|nr:hypothetical protein GGR56DRAFT_575279 [Xylariaceae sp. FL0804]
MAGATSSSVNATAAADTRLSVAQGDDESEWEYEYSTTETETFYVTLDLSKPDFTSQNHEAFVAGRNGYPGARSSEFLVNRRNSRPSLSPPGSAGNSDAELDEDQEQEEDHLTHRPGKSPDQRTGEEVERVQILDLHSENPLVSYKGRVYSGQWSENVTTELLMTKHNKHEPLPILRRMENDVDLLAASCARITVTERELKSKADARKPLPGPRQSVKNTVPGTLIPPAADGKPNPERVKQGNFLANLIQLKKRKGETDEVTVIADNDAASRDQRIRRVGKYRRGPRTRGRYRKGLGTLERLSSSSAWGETGHDGSWGGAPAAHSSLFSESFFVPPHDVSPAAPPASSRSLVSTPTPSHWSELDGDGGPDDMEDMMEGNEAQYGDITGYSSDKVDDGDEDAMEEDEEDEEEEDEPLDDIEEADEEDFDGVEEMDVDVESPEQTRT